MLLTRVKDLVGKNVTPGVATHSDFKVQRLKVHFRQNRKTFLTSSILVISFFILIGSKAVQAVTPLNVQELATLCDKFPAEPSKTESIKCVKYIKGFIDGVLAADPQVQQEQSKEESSSFVQRAMTTRIGSKIGRDKSTPDPEFCLGTDFDLNAVVTTVVKDIKAQENKDQSALLHVFQSLRANYPCTLT